MDEDREILKLNLDRFRRLLAGETDPAKRRTIETLISETVTKLNGGGPPGRSPSRGAE